jgi:hypothetical protein
MSMWTTHPDFTELRVYVILCRNRKRRKGMPLGTLTSGSKFLPTCHFKKKIVGKQQRIAKPISTLIQGGSKRSPLAGFLELPSPLPSSGS